MFYNWFKYLNCRAASTGTALIRAKEDQGTCKPNRLIYQEGHAPITPPVYDEEDEPESTPPPSPASPLTPEQQAARDREEAERRNRSSAEIDSVRRSIRERVQSTLSIVEYYSGMTASKEERVKFTDLRKELQQINTDDEKVISNIRRILKTEILNGHIPRQNLDAAKAIVGLNAADKKELKKALQQIRSVPSHQRNQITGLKKEEWKIADRFERVFGKAVELINPITDRISKTIKQETHIKRAENMLGVSLKPGTRIHHISRAPGHEGQPSVFQIASVDIERVHLESDSQNKQEVLGPIRVTSEDGQVLSLGNLQKEILDYEGQKTRERGDQRQGLVCGYEIIDSKLSLEETLGWNALGVKIEPGMEIAYDIYAAPNGKPREERVKVEHIMGNYIKLSKKVKVRPAIDREKRTLTFGEFAMWVRKNNAQKAIKDEVEFRSILQKYNASYNKKNGFEAKDNPPIELKKGEKIIINQNPPLILTLDDVGPNKILLSNGAEFTFPQFIRYVMDNDVSHYVSLQEKYDRKKKEEDEEQNKKEKEGKLEEEPTASKEEEKQEEAQESGLMAALRDFDRNTVWLSGYDIFALIKSIKDYIERRHNRKSQHRFSTVGKALPGNIKIEMNRINQAAENEEVNLYGEAMKQWGVQQIRETLQQTKIKDQAKACFIALAERGQVRWDDKKMWKTLNRLIPTRLQIPTEMPERKTPEDYLSKGIDYLWGENQYNSWHTQNNSAYDQETKKFIEKGKQLEGGPTNIALGGYMQDLLTRWKNGDWVDPHEYEGLIDFSIPFGKMTAEDKLFYLIEGVTAKNPNTGETLLPLERLGNMDGQYLNKLPMLDYFVDKSFTKVRGGENTIWTQKDFQRIVDWWSKSPDIKSARDMNKPNSRVREFLWKFVLTHHKVQLRNSKGIRNADQMDHDDAHIIIPVASDEEVDRTLRVSMAANEYWTTEARMNAFAGFNQFIKSVGSIEKKEIDRWGPKVDQADRLKKSLKSYIRYDSILSNRYHYGDKEYSRVSDDKMKYSCVVDRRTAQEFRSEMRNLMKILCDEYNLQDFYRDIYEITIDPSQGNFQQNVQRANSAVENFSKRFDAAVEKGGEEKLVRIVKRAVDQGVIKGMSSQVLPKEVIENYRKEQLKASGQTPEPEAEAA